jgi:hypothetical protein
MQQSSCSRHWSSMLALVLAASACAAEEDGDEDTGAGTDTGMASNTSPVTDPTDPTNVTAADDDESTTDTPGDDTGPGDDGATDPTVADDDGGSDEANDDGASSDDGGATTGAEGSTVFGTVSRSAAAAIAGGNDGIGTFYIGVLVECSQDAASVAANAVEIDVSAQDTPAVWEVNGVPDGHYFLAGFLDDNGNANPDDPYADMGDLAAAEGFGPACLDVTIAGDEVAAGQFVLNIAVPF